MIKDYHGHIPRIDETAYVSEHALVIGHVMLDAGVSLWPGCVLRGDVEDILVGEDTNLQDGVLVHTSRRLPVMIGKGVTVGHRAVLHGCTIGDNCLIGMGAIVLDGAKIGKNCIVGAGSVVKEGDSIPSGYLALGAPARVVRPLTDDEVERMKTSAREYRRLAETYRRQA